MDIEVLSKKTLTDLKAIAKIAGIKGVSTMRKEELLSLLISMNEEAVSPKPVNRAAEQPEPVQQKEKKKRGRKPKPKQETVNAEELTKASVTEPEETSLIPETAEEEPEENEDEQQSGPQQRGSEAEGILEIHADGYGFLRNENFLPGNRDVYVSMTQIRRLGLRIGDMITGKTRVQKESDNKSQALLYVDTINDKLVRDSFGRPQFEDLTPIFPDERFKLEDNGTEDDYSCRLIDIIAPIGKGQRGLIVAPPKAGKTTILKSIANGITRNAPNTKLIVLLIDERPEEVTDMQRSIKGDVVYSTFDEKPENHTRVSELVIERAKRLVELGEDVVILLDSITRLTRAYNLTVPPSGRTLTGGLDPSALYKPKRFFGAARNIENGGSLTIIATALVDTGSRMDDYIYEEFKGTGNMELHLDRGLSERRIFPAIDIAKSGTRREEMLLEPDEMRTNILIRRYIGASETSENAEQIINLIRRTRNNEEFISRLTDYQRNLEKQGYKLTKK
ncbi:MAG: transcription termination factor Rho [Clostridia bacterium]|nr:transcription termination factor Rho [Clostridia bacterium]MBQ5956854.1 transcription termination factor Rho [Clostridia bacterium]